MQFKVEDGAKLAALVMRLGKVNRVTQHPCGMTYETDTTHTVMLALLAVGLAPQIERLSSRPLDPGLVAAFAMVHELCEAYAGDVNTARGLTEEEARQKKENEAEALMRVRDDLSGFPSLVALVGLYEAQEEPEARYVRYCDKLMPKLTHILNQGSALRDLGMSAEEMAASHVAQGMALWRTYPEFPALAEVFQTVCDAAELAVDLDAQP